MDTARVKREPVTLEEEKAVSNKAVHASHGYPVAVIDLDSSDDSDSDVEDGDAGEVASDGRKRGKSAEGERGAKRSRWGNAAVALPLGFLDPLFPEEMMPLVPLPEPKAEPLHVVPLAQLAMPRCKQFWKAGDYEKDAASNGRSSSLSAGIDHVRVHPKFLHSNATSHKWALGAFAELLDNAIDEVCNGATFVNVDVLENQKDNSRMLLIEDNGGGMDPDRMRQCMSLGYSAKSKSANTIGQYGNGFKTSTMRLGADVIVFSRWRGKNGMSPTQTIGLLSYTFLRGTGKEDIIVPMLDYEREGMSWKSTIRSSLADWERNLETIMQWSPFYSEADLLQQFNYISDQGTRIIIYNLWEDDQGDLELDFSTDPNDIQIRGVNRDERKIEMARQFPNSKHFLTYRHSFRSYASILYLRLPLGFRITLRGKDIDHHNIVDDMMYAQEITYRPQHCPDGVPKDANMIAVVTVGFVKDAKEHIDVQGFNVYHKNRLIKPFWRVWNAAGSDGRGVIGVLEANFVEPAHDKQGFERTTVLQRLETRLVQMQKTYWAANCDKIGYAPRRQKKQVALALPSVDKHQSAKESSRKLVNGHRSNGRANVPVFDGVVENGNLASRPGSKLPFSQSTSEDDSDGELLSESKKSVHKGASDELQSSPSVGKEQSRNGPDMTTNLNQLEAENIVLRVRNEALEARVIELEKMLQEANKEQEALIDLFSAEKIRRDAEEENMRKRLKDASVTVQHLLDRTPASSNNIKREH